MYIYCILTVADGWGISYVSVQMWETSGLAYLSRSLCGDCMLYFHVPNSFLFHMYASGFSCCMSACSDWTALDGDTADLFHINPSIIAPTVLA
eukprot:3862592-Pleurochrysis_carterae.AAC.2